MGYRVALAELLTALGIRHNFGIHNGYCLFEIQYKGVCFKRYVHYWFVKRFADYLYESLDLASTDITVFLKRLLLSVEDSILTGRGSLNLLDSGGSIFVLCEGFCLRDLTELSDNIDLKELKLSLAYEVGDDEYGGLIRYEIPGCDPNVTMIQSLDCYALSGCNCTSKVKQIIDDAIADLCGWKLMFIRRMSGSIIVCKLPLNQDGEITVEQIKNFLLDNSLGLSPLFGIELDYVCELKSAHVSWFREVGVYKINPVEVNTSDGEVIDLRDLPPCN